MAYHVPFSQRPSGRHQRPVYYIGFDSPRRFRRPRNWWGINSVILFFLSVGILSPITFLMGLRGLSKGPRGAAFVGTGLSLAGLTIMTLIALAVSAEAKEAQERYVLRQQQAVNAVQIAETQALLSFAAEEFEGYRDDNDGHLPSQEDGMQLSIKHLDGWDNELMYETRSDFAGLRSAGPDGKFFNTDDLTREISGETMEESPLLPVNGEAEEVELD